jgi:hypothetical protein
VQFDANDFAVAEEVAVLGQTPTNGTASCAVYVPTNAAPNEPSADGLVV